MSNSVKGYQPEEFEAKWREYWETEQTYKTPEVADSQNKRYCLSMFPYPSGEGLHVGHVRIYTGTDVLARYFRMQGRAVLHPMGWDAFGLPAENAAIKVQKNPLDMVPKNIENFKRQMQSLGLSYDWSRELSTADPEYYRFTQWLFIEFFKLGLLYKKDMPVYYCESCKTGLAEEEVLPDGTHERCGKPITRKNLPQWIFKITQYADSLLSGLKDLNWPKGILEMQKNWIGKKEGINITYHVEGTKETVTCFTTRPDTNFGATFVVVAPEHQLVGQILSGEIKVGGEVKTKVAHYYQKSLAKTDQERVNEGRKKTGAFTGLYAINELNGKKMPIWVSDFVLAGFGTGAVVGVPAHDLRDFEFAKEFNLEIIRVVVGSDKDQAPITQAQQVLEEAGTVVNSQFLNGLDTYAANVKIIDYLEEHKLGKRMVSYHLRDWIFSRQRYWGEPIPIVYCAACAKKKISYWNTPAGKTNKLIQNNNNLKQTVSKRVQELSEAMAGYFPLEESQLPLKLPYIKNYQPTDTGKSPLSRVANWVEITCPHCKGVAVRETDTMPNWAGSCWYFLRFPNITPGVIRSNRELHNPYLPVDWYLGGAEHAVLHLLYARFWVHILNDLGMLPFREPFLRLRNVGMVLATDHHKMSKSLGNVINPDSVVKKYGADTLRVYEMFMAPFSMEIAWSEASMLGANRFLSKIYQTYANPARIAKEGQKEDLELVAKLQITIEKISNDIANVKFNTAIAALMEFLNTWQKGVLSLSNAQKYLQLLAPFAPFLAEELWQNRCKNKTSVHLSVWPKAESAAQIKANLKIPVTVNSKLRALLVADAQTANHQSELVKLALKEEKVAKYLEGQKYRVVFVPGKILNFILE